MRSNARGSQRGPFGRPKQGLDGKPVLSLAGNIALLFHMQSSVFSQPQLGSRGFERARASVSSTEIAWKETNERARNLRLVRHCAEVISSTAFGRRQGGGAFLADRLWLENTFTA